MPVHLDGAEVNEDVDRWSAVNGINGDEAVTLFGVEPFDRAGDLVRVFLPVVSFSAFIGYSYVGRRAGWIDGAAGAILDSC